MSGQNQPRGLLPGLDAICQDLTEDITNLHAKWQLYGDLYFEPASVNVLNGTAQAAFQMFEESLRDSMTMAIARLTDPAKTRSQDNLTLETLLQEVKKHVDAPIAQAFEDFGVPRSAWRQATSQGRGTP